MCVCNNGVAVEGGKHIADIKYVCMLKAQLEEFDTSSMMQKFND